MTCSKGQAYSVFVVLHYLVGGEGEYAIHVHGRARGESREPSTWVGGCCVDRTRNLPEISGDDEARGKQAEMKKRKQERG